MAEHTKDCAYHVDQYEWECTCGRMDDGAQAYAARSWPEDHSHENGNYFCLCVHCGQQFTGHKRRVTCRKCAQPNVERTDEAKSSA